MHHLYTHAHTSIHDRSLSICVLVRVSIAVVKHHDQKRLGKERVYGLYFQVTVYDCRKSGQEPGVVADVEVI